MLTIRIILALSLLIVSQIRINLTQDLDIIVPTHEVDLAAKRTRTRIFIDFKVLTLEDTDLTTLTDSFQRMKSICTKVPAGQAPAELNVDLLNVLKDLKGLGDSIQALNVATKGILNQNNHKPVTHRCTSEWYLISKEQLKDTIESLALTLAVFPLTFEFEPSARKDPSSEKFKLVANALLSIKGIVHDFFSLLEKQYSYLLEVENFKLPNIMFQHITQGDCVHHVGVEKYSMERIKNYKEGIFITIKLVQSHEIQTYMSWRAVPFTKYIVDLPAVLTSISDNKTFLEQVCTNVDEIKNCEIKAWTNPCIDAIIGRHLSNVLKSCAIVQNENKSPFLSLNGVVVVQHSELKLTDPKTQSMDETLTLPENPNNLPILVRSEKSLIVELENNTFYFGPTGTETEIVMSYLTEQDLMSLMLFDYPWLDPQNQIMISLISSLGITASIVIILIWKINKPKTPQEIKRYEASFKPGRHPTVIKIKRKI